MKSKYLHTIEDNIIKDVYSAISNHYNDKMYFAGGMSTQFFLPENLHRPSSDIDMNGIPKYSLTEFQKVIAGGLEELLENYYL